MSAQTENGGERQVRVLVVDDEATIIEFLGMGLGYEGFAVESASDGPSALAVADRFRPEPGIDRAEQPPAVGLDLHRVDAGKVAPIRAGPQVEHRDLARRRDRQGHLIHHGSVPPRGRNEPGR